jgi:hypothetical protein
LWTPVTHSAWWVVATFSSLDSVAPGAIRLNPWTFHAFNVLLHCVASVLVYLLAHRVVPCVGAALAGAAVFAAHPVQVEAVAWTCGTKDILAALFSFAAILFATSRDGVWRLSLAIAFAALAMLSKPSAVMVPAMLVAYQWLSGTGIPACDSADEKIDLPSTQTGMSVPLNVWLVTLAMFVLAIPVTMVARKVQIVGDVPPVSLLARPLVALDTIAMHLSHLLSLRWCADYGLTPAQLLSTSRRWWTWLVPVVLTLTAVHSRDRVLVGGIALFVIALAPNLGLASFQFQVYSTVADRYAYPAMLGVAVVVARLLAMNCKRSSSGTKSRWSVFAVGSLAIVGMCVGSFRQCATWADAGSLWSHTLTVNADSSLAHNNLGASLMAAGDLRGAMAHFEIAASNGSATDGFALLNLAQLHLRLGEADKAADAVIRLVQTYRIRAEFDAELEAQTIDQFARQIARIDPAAAERLRQQVRR